VKSVKSAVKIFPNLHDSSLWCGKELSKAGATKGIQRKDAKTPGRQDFDHNLQMRSPCRLRLCALATLRYH
jgi:hypothetical protein